MNQKTMDVVCGKDRKMEALLWVGFFFVAISIAGAVALAAIMVYENRITNLPMVFLVFAFVIAVLVMYIRLMIKRNTHSKELKEKFRKLLPEQQEEVLHLAENCPFGKRMYFNEHYVYGNLVRVKKADERSKNVIVFEYIPLTDIARVHLLETSANIGQISQGVMTTTTVTEKECCVYTYRGECYKGIGDEFFIAELKEQIQPVNPGCKFGYSDDRKW